MKSNFSVLLLAGLLAACGPSKSELRSELREIESEMLSIELQTQEHLARMDQAAFKVTTGSFSAGYGLTSGEYETLDEGIDTVVSASRRYDVAAHSIEQLSNRYRKLEARRNEILDELN
ncbi:putative nucleic acid-binding Zn-ribbon protein [Haloferula luteola]|uniref:Putative nucleic acid-binding Zn-ribbon protein n=1 Tax=Haloferula luteola TaxID=595692 RepID=A0A840V787_9BACT|nr:hypothetical protein [Haloferula luteola]MBB5353842.1 putative nucleic acid-binding Zn-ribbon protein [Haloferula luteola]